MPAEPLVVHAEVREAIASRRAVVALESTVITHGMPYPACAETARELEAAVRDNAAVPATIAVIDGRLHVGLDEKQLDRLARDRGAVKASRRDLAVIVAGGMTAGTTVAATMLIAARAGIPVFATGGIGGVHRGAEGTFDISADLIELAMSPVAVVCAGAKSILDLPKTLEVLETNGVPVIGYRTSEMPAFFSRTSGLKLSHRMEDPDAVASVIRAQRLMGLSGGLLICNPLPTEDEVPASEIEPRIEEAVRDAEAKGITGKDVTPFLLSRLVELTGGRSLEANRKLIGNNARLGAEIAVALARQTPESGIGFLRAPSR
jgi:pseudouridylate synthase